MEDAAAPHDLPVFDASVLASLPLVADGTDPGFVREMLDLYARSSAALLQQIESHLRTGDQPRLQRALHTLKSSSAQVGAVALADLSRRLEAEIKAGQRGQSAWLESLLAAHRQLMAATADAGIAAGPSGRLLP